MPDIKRNVIEWGVRWPHGEIEWTPGGEKVAREMAASKGAKPFRRIRTEYYDDTTDWLEVQ